MATTTALINNPLETLLIFVTILLLIPFIVKSIKVPEIIGFIFMGVIVGEYGLNILQVNSAVTLLQTVGILYIMFIAGLELDIDQFLKVKYKSISFGMLTGFLPGFFLFTVLFFGLKFSFLSSLLLADIIASHTVMTYPIVSQIGASKNESVVVTLGATMLTDTLSLLLLAIIVVLNSNNSISITYLLGFIVNLAIFVILAIIILTRIARFFFSKHHTSETEFQFALFVMLSTAVLANVIKLEGIIGAFIGGLAINRLIPKESRLMRLTEFIGKAFFIPIFIIYIGMLVDITAFFQNPNVLIYALLLTSTLLLGKYIASWFLAHLYGYSNDERILVFSLTIPQVGATLATLFVGHSIGLINSDFLSAGIIMVVITNFLAPLITSKYAPNLIKEKSSEDKPMGISTFNKKILIPFSSINLNKSVIDLAGFLARQSEGIIYPLIVLGDEDKTRSDSEIDITIKEYVKLGNDLNVQTKPIKRIESNITDGILDVTKEIGASMLVFNWKEYNSHKLVHFSNLIDQVIVKTEIPSIICKIPGTISSIENLIIIISDNEINSFDFQSYLYLIKIISKSLNKRLIIYDISHYSAYVNESITKSHLESPFEIKVNHSFTLRKIKKEIKETDLIIVNFPLTHPLISNESFTSSNTYYYASINSNNPILVLYFPELYSNRTEDTSSFI